MRSITFKQYISWYNKVQQRIDELNIKNEFTTLHYYSLGYRGKNRRLCLLRDDLEVLACGIKQITQALFLLRNKSLYQD